MADTELTDGSLPSRAPRDQFGMAMGVLSFTLTVLGLFAEDRTQAFICLALIGWLATSWLILARLGWSRRSQLLIAIPTIAVCMLGVIAVVRSQADQTARPPGLSVLFDARPLDAESRLFQPRATVAPGDTIEMLVTVQNLGGSVTEDITTRVVPAPNFELVPGSVTFITSIDRSTQSDKPLFDGGIDAGNFAPSGGFYFTYRAKALSTNRCSTLVRATAYTRSDQTPYEREAPVDIEIVDNEYCG